MIFRIVFWIQKGTHLLPAHAIISVPRCTAHRMPSNPQDFHPLYGFFYRTGCFGLDKRWVPTKAAPSLPFLTWTGERKYDEDLEGRDKDRERSLTNYRHGQTRLNLGRKGSLIHHQSNQSRIMRNKSRSYNTFPPSLPSSRSQLHSRFSPSSPRAVQGDREWGWWSVHRLLSRLLLPPQGRTPHTLPLLQRGVPLKGDSSPQTSPT